MKHFRPALLLLAVAVFSGSAWADGIDPKVIIQKGSGSIPITLQNPNPFFPPPGQPPLIAGQNSHCLTASDACVFEVFQNQTGQTVHNLTIAINDLQGFSFQCGDLSQILFFSKCSSQDNGSVTDVFFSGGDGVGPATQQCVGDTDPILGAIDKVLFALPGSCQKWDPDDYQFVGGEFGLLIDATASENFAGQSVSGQTITTPEPGAGIMVLFSALAFGLLKLVRRAA